MKGNKRGKLPSKDKEGKGYIGIMLLKLYRGSDTLVYPGIYLSLK